MKRICLAILLIWSVTLFAADEKKTVKTTTTTTTDSKSSANDETIKKNERTLWDAWKNHDNKPFNDLLAEDAMILDDPSSGFQEKKVVLPKMSEATCDVKSYSFDNERITWIDKDAAIYTYTATVDATCGGQKVPDKVNSSSVWAKRGGKWMGMFHQETPAMPPMGTSAEKSQ